MAGRRDWTALTSAILQSIAERLGLMDLLSFRGVCKVWRSASSTASAEIEALRNPEPWFLIYGKNNSECTLVTHESDRIHSITIPELDGATCLGSSHGWLLLLRQGEGSMFFFCPFSRAKIDLPVPRQFPRTSGYAGIFSSPPTSEDCVACIYSKINQRELELYVIHRGAAAWTKHEFVAPLKEFMGAAYDNGKFYFFDNLTVFICFSIENRRLGLGMHGLEAGEKFITLRSFSDDEKKNIRKRLLLGFEKGYPRSICGTAVSCHGSYMTFAYKNMENAEEAGLKGVWLQPRFHRIDQNQSW